MILCEVMLRNVINGKLYYDFGKICVFTNRTTQFNVIECNCYFEIVEIDSKM